MTALKRWVPVVGKPDATGGAAIFEHDGAKLTVFLQCEADAHALDAFIDRAMLRTRRTQAKADIQQLEALAGAWKAIL